MTELLAWTVLVLTGVGFLAIVIPALGHMFDVCHDGDRYIVKFFAGLAVIVGLSVGMGVMLTIAWALSVVLN